MFFFFLIFCFYALCFCCFFAFVVFCVFVFLLFAFVAFLLWPATTPVSLLRTRNCRNSLGIDKTTALFHCFLSATAAACRLRTLNCGNQQENASRMIEKNSRHNFTEVLSVRVCLDMEFLMAYTNLDKQDGLRQ